MKLLVGLLFVVSLVLAQEQQTANCQSECSLRLLSRIFEKTKECSQRCQPMSQNNQECIISCIRESRDALLQEYDRCMQECEGVSQTQMQQVNQMQQTQQMQQMNQMQQMPPMPAPMPPQPMFWGWGPGFGWNYGWNSPWFGWGFLDAPPPPPPAFFVQAMPPQQQGSFADRQTYTDEDLGEGEEVGEDMYTEPETPRETLPRPTRLITFLKDQLQDQTDACSRQCARDLLRCVEQARDGCSMRCSSTSSRRDCLTSCLQSAMAECKSTFATCRQNCLNVTALWTARHVQRYQPNEDEDTGAMQPLRKPTGKELEKTQEFKGAGRAKEAASAAQTAGSKSKKSLFSKRKENPLAYVSLADRTCVAECRRAFAKCLKEAHTQCTVQCGATDSQNCMRTCLQNAIPTCNATLQECVAGCPPNMTALWLEARRQASQQYESSESSRQTTSRIEEANDDEDDDDTSDAMCINCRPRRRPPFHRRPPPPPHRLHRRKPRIQCIRWPCPLEDQSGDE